jgi:RNA polymerase sigma-70 factor (ECF subfamily)
MRGDMDFDTLVDQHYAALYRFAFSLSGSESDASDLVHETFYILLNKAGQIADHTKVKSWLFTTLYRRFLGRRKHFGRFPHHEITEAENELPDVPPQVESADWPEVTRALAAMDTVFRAPIALFYLEDYSYPQIAQILGVPLGTVKSRISRGIGVLQHMLREPCRAGEETR